MEASGLNSLVGQYFTFYVSSSQTTWLNLTLNFVVFCAHS